MHYGTYDFSKNKKPTIYVKKNDILIADENLGQAMRLSQVPQWANFNKWTQSLIFQNS